MSFVITIALFCASLRFGPMEVQKELSSQFGDVPERHWAADAVESLSRRGIVIGYPDEKYRGNRAITRDELAVAIDRLLWRGGGTR
jgi:hypothetical protein